jgi:hypothetical protein
VFAEAYLAAGDERGQSGCAGDRAAWTALRRPIAEAIDGPGSLLNIECGARGSFVVRVDAFEDTGARWELGLEEIERFQFARAATPATDAALPELQDSAARFDHDLAITCDQAAREDSLGVIARRQARVSEGCVGETASGCRCE